jgi:ketosteroid isomerase-like protein
VACDGSLAITSGTWTYTTSAGGPGESGQYLTAWRRDATGDWRIVLDQSLTGAAAAARDVAAPTAVRACPRGEASLRALRSADERVGTQVRGRNAAGADVIVPVRAVATGTVAGGPESDIALTHGELIAKRRAKRGQGPSVLAVYVRVWSRSGSGWQLQRDLVTPVGATDD